MAKQKQRSSIKAAPTAVADDPAEDGAQGSAAETRPVAPSGNRRRFIIGGVTVALLALLAIPLAVFGGRFIGHHHVGETVQVGSSWAITVTSVTTSQSLDGSQAAKGYVYLVVNLAARNVSSQPQALSDLAFYGPFDGSGNNYPGSISLNGTVAPNVTAKGTLIAEIPTSLHSVTIECDDQNENSLSNIWDITVP